MPLDRDRYLEYIIPHRLHAIAVLNLAANFLQSGEHPKEMTIRFDDKIVIQGDSFAYINPVLESGVIGCRVLLDFLGLKEDRHQEMKIAQRTGKKPDEIRIEDFSTHEVMLHRLTKEDALNLFTWPPEATERSLCTVIRDANRVVAHLTDYLPTDPDTLKLYEQASIVVPILIVNYLYKPLNMPMPDFQIGSRQR